MKQCSIFISLLKNEYIEVEFNKARYFCSFRCLSNPYSCTVNSLIFRTQGVRALLFVDKFLREQVSVRIAPCASFQIPIIPETENQEHLLIYCDQYFMEFDIVSPTGMTNRHLVAYCIFHRSNKGSIKFSIYIILRPT